MTGCCRKPIRGRTSHSPPRGSAFSSRLRTRVISSPAALRSPPPMSAGLPPSSSSASRTSISRRSRKFCSRLPRTWVRRDATANSDLVWSIPIGHSTPSRTKSPRIIQLPRRRRRRPRRYPKHSGSANLLLATQRYPRLAARSPRETTCAPAWRKNASSAGRRARAKECAVPTCRITSSFAWRKLAWLASSRQSRKKSVERNAETSSTAAWDRSAPSAGVYGIGASSSHLHPGSREPPIEQQWRDRPTGSTQRLERRLGDSEHDEECDRRRRDEIVRRCQVAAGNTDQPSRDERSEAAEHRHRDVVAD